MTLPALVAYGVSSGNWLITIVSALLGAVPDVVNNKYYKLAPSIDFYNILHRPWLHFKKWWAFVYVVLWPMGLHCFCDYWFHTDDDNMRNLRIMITIEVGFWLIILAWICLH